MQDHAQAPDPSSPLGTFPSHARDFVTALLYQRLVSAFQPGGRWGDFTTGPNIVHQLLVSAAFLSGTEPLNCTAGEITPEKGAELIGLDVGRLGSTLDVEIRDTFGLLACCLMSRPNSPERRMARRELQAAIILAADAGARARADVDPEEVRIEGSGNDRTCTVSPAKNVSFKISYAEASGFEPQLPATIEELWHEVALEAARRHFVLPSV